MRNMKCILLLILTFLNPINGHSTDIGLQCFQKNYYYIMCTWDVKQFRNASCWSIRYKGNGTYTECRAFEISSKMACKLDKCHAYENCLISVQNLCDPRDTGYEKLIPVDDTNVKLDPVHRDEIATRLSPRTLNLTWRLTMNPCGVFNDPGGIECHVGVKSSNENIYKAVILNKHDCMQQPTCDHCDVMHMSMNNLQPYTNYNVSLQCRVTGSAFWSEITLLAIRTKLEAPRIGPMVVSGGYLQYFKNKQSHLVVYWKGISLSEAYGELLGYNVSTLSCDIDITRDETAIIKLGKAQKHQYTVNIWAYNSKGLSEKSSTLRIFTSKEKPRPKYVISEYQGNFTFNVSWYDETINSVDQVVYYWCAGTLEQTNNPVVVKCKSNFTWVIDNTLDKRWHQFKLKRSLERRQLGIYFAVSVEVNGRSSGLVWEQCRKSISDKKVICPQAYKSTRRENEIRQTAIIPIAISSIFTVILIIIFVARYIYKVTIYKPDITIPNFPGNKSLLETNSVYSMDSNKDTTKTL